MFKKNPFGNIAAGGGIFYERLGRRRFASPDLGTIDSSFRGLTFFKLAALLIGGIFLVRLFILGVVQGEKNRALSENNRIRLVPVEAMRGAIFDRDGKLLASSEREYFLSYDGGESKISHEQVEELTALGLASEDFEGDLGRIEQRVVRKYSLGEKSAHVLGYTSRADTNDLKTSPALSPFDFVGRLGIEASHDDFLRGVNGKKLIEIDANSREVSLLGNKQDTGGGEVKLTIRSDLASTAYDSLKKQADKIGSKRGAVIVGDPNTGEVLAMASYPSFDPENIAASVTNQNKPYFNRAIAGVYPPGSVFKIVTAVAGLESGKVNGDTEIEDVGEFSIGDIKFSNWFYTQYGQKDGILKLDRAIARSNDIFFYKWAETVGLEAIRDMAIKLGFGQKTGVDLPGEEFGLVPDEVWKKSQFGEVWFPGDTMHLGIGQGFMLVTPMQISQMTGFMASGKLMRPYLVSEIKTKDKEVKINPKIIAENPVKQENFDLVRRGMKMACQKGGTGWPFFEASYTVGCKTGTAERAEGNPNAWFTAFAPFENPQVAVTVLIEDGGEGSSVAAPVAREILDWWFKIKNN